jgi:ABC-type sugar transport system permease subunit
MTNMQKKEARWGLVFLTPWMIGFVLFYLAPMIASFIFSLYDFNPAVPDQAKFIGFENWQRALFVDTRSAVSFLRTLHFAAISLPIGLGFSLVPGNFAQFQKRARQKHLPHPVLYADHDPRGRRRADLGGSSQRTNRLDQCNH